LQLKQYEIPLGRCMLADPARAPVVEIWLCFFGQS
jgi:hypothetical protein